LTLWDAPFRKPLRILTLSGFGGEVRLVLAQLGLDAGETVEKMHSAPLKDPVSLRIGEQLFALRAEVCRKIQVEAL
jgi:Fe2+ transport system protein FeoA